MSNNYTPDSWVILKISGYDPHYRVLAGWSGGYLDGDSWRLNSGITSHEFDGYYWYFYGSSKRGSASPLRGSGSCYKCYIDSYRMSLVMLGAYNKLVDMYGEDVVEVIEDQEWREKEWDWIIKSDTT